MCSQVLLLVALIQALPTFCKMKQEACSGKMLNCYVMALVLYERKCWIPSAQIKRQQMTTDVIQKHAQHSMKGAPKPKKMETKRHTHS